MTIKEFCDKHNACEEGSDWAIENCKDMDEVWQNAKPEWLVWVATREGVLTDKELRLFAVWSARRVQHLMTDDRSITALDVAERYANGNATDEELKAARDAAWRAVRDARATPWSAFNAAAAAAEEARVAWSAFNAAAAAVAEEAREAAGGAACEAWNVAWEAAATAATAQAQYLRKNCKPTFER